MRFTRIRASRTAIVSTFLVVFALVSSMVVNTIEREDASAQGVSWLSNESINYLTSSSGIPVMVPSWLPGPVAGTTPEIYAGGGSYSIYFYSGSSFLYITGVAGGGFPGGSEADLNVELTINASVQGWPAIQDIGIPAGASNPIYDKTMWIADGVFYTVNGGGLDSDSLSLANSSVTLYPQQAAPVETEPVVVEEPVNQQPVNQAPVSNTGVSTSPTGEPNTQPVTGDSSTSSTTTTDTTSTGSTTETGSTSSEAVAPTPTPAGGSDGTSGAWFTGGLTEDPSDGTDGALPPFLGGDGTGGAP